jgi:hypothetical protein
MKECASRYIERAANQGNLQGRLNKFTSTAMFFEDTRKPAAQSMVSVLERCRIKCELHASKFIEAEIHRWVIVTPTRFVGYFPNQAILVEFHISLLISHLMR